MTTSHYIAANKVLSNKTYYSVVYPEFILYWLCRKLLAYRNALESVPGNNQCSAMSVKVLAHGINVIPLTGFEPMRLTILN